MDAVGTAHLTSDILAQRAVGASVSRRQITDVLHEPDGAPELVLDLVAAEGDEHATISMTWSRDDLEQLLESASGDEMVLVFDRNELASALGDVEAHGARARAAVFAVGDPLKTNVLLHLHHLAYRLVFDPALLPGIDPTVGEVLPGAMNGRRPEQAADMVGPKRRLCSIAHEDPGTLNVDCPV